MSQPKVILCIPHGRYVLGEWHATALSSLYQQLPPGSQVLERPGPHLDVLNRAFVYEALGQPRDSWDWMWINEDDVVPPPAALQYLASYPPGIVGLLVYHRDVADQHPLAGWVRKSTLQHFWLSDAELGVAQKGLGLFPVDMVSLSSTLIHRSVFEKWDPNHDSFATPDHQKMCLTRAHWPPFQMPPGPDLWSTMTADVFFCHHAREQGFQVFLEPRIECRHITETPIHSGTNERWRVYRDDRREQAYAQVPWGRIYGSLSMKGQDLVVQGLHGAGQDRIAADLDMPF